MQFFAFSFVSLPVATVAVVVVVVAASAAVVVVAVDAPSRLENYRHRTGSLRSSKRSGAEYAAFT